MKSPGFSAGKAVLAAALFLVPALLFFALSDRGGAGWTAESQIYHGGSSWIETEVVKLTAPVLLGPTAAAEAMTVDELLVDWDVDLVPSDFVAEDRRGAKLLKLSYTSDDPSQAMRVVTSVTSRYMQDAAPLVSLAGATQRLRNLEADHLEAIDELDALMANLDESSVAFSDAKAMREGLRQAAVDVQTQLELFEGADRADAGSEVVGSPFLLPQQRSNAVSQTLIGLALGALLASAFLLLVRYGERRSNGSLAMQVGNGQEVPQAFPR